jgi:hypothetical protein
MRRQDALFEGSRLYRQAAEGSRELVDALLEERDTTLPFQQLVPTGTLVVTSSADLSPLVERQLTVITTLGKSVSAYHALPVLSEATEQTYYGPEDRRIDGLGPPLKIASAMAYLGVSAPREQTSASIGALAELVRACHLLDLLLVARMHAALAPSGTIRVGADGITMDDPTATQFERAFAAKGRNARLADSTAKAVLRQETLHGVRHVLEGAAPGTVDELRDTVLGGVADTNRDFWGGLFVRLLLLKAAADTRLAVTTDRCGTVILGRAGFQMEVGQLDGKHLQAVMQGAFWTSAWRDLQPPDALRHLVVRRPVQRIAPHTELFVTTLGYIVDSISSWVEGAVFREAWVGSAALKETCFQSLVSTPFEEKTASIFQRHGFAAARVTEFGRWEPDTNGRDLMSELGDNPPGEIDVLAVHPLGFVVVAECKVLASPYEVARVRNVASKLSPDDAEGFRSKLRRKAEWVRRLERRLIPTYQGVLEMIVLDRFLPGSLYSDPGIELVVDLASLDQALSELIQRTT